MFPNARNFQIKGGQFVINYPGGGTPHLAKGMLLEYLISFSLYLWTEGLDLLHLNCSFGSLLDSEERFNPPRCAEETREAIIRDLLQWVENGDHETSLIWLHGAAGVGKSALAQTLAELCRKNTRLMASFFFSKAARSSDRSDGNFLIPTLVYQLMQSLPETKRYIEAYLEQDPGIFSKSRETQMESLFVKPLQLAHAAELASLEAITRGRFSIGNIFKRLTSQLAAGDLVGIPLRVQLTEETDIQA